MLQNWNPWQELGDRQRRLGRALREGDTPSWVPATDVGDDNRLCLDLPDVDEGSLEVTSEQNSLSIKATRRYRSEGQTVHRQGRPKDVLLMSRRVSTSAEL